MDSFPNGLRYSLDGRQQRGRGAPARPRARAARRRRAERLEVVEGLLQEVDELRARAAATREAIAALPEQVRQAERAAVTARERQSIAAAELADAEHRLVEVSRSRRSSARRARPRNARASSEGGIERCRADRDADGSVVEDLAASEPALRAAGELIEVEARALAPVVAAVPRLSDSGRVVPDRTLEGAWEWAARAHAALFVVRGSLVSERERVVVEAGGLAAAVLGEHVGGASVALVRSASSRRWRRLADATWQGDCLSSVGASTLAPTGRRVVRSEIEVPPFRHSAEKPVVEPRDALVGEIAVALCAHQCARRRVRRAEPPAERGRLPAARSTPSPPRPGRRGDVLPRGRGR